MESWRLQGGRVGFWTGGVEFLSGENAGTARNPNLVATLTIGTTDTTIAAIVNRLNELINASVR